MSKTTTSAALLAAAILAAALLTGCASDLSFTPTWLPLATPTPIVGTFAMRDAAGRRVLDPLGECDEWLMRQREGARPAGCAGMEE